MNDSLETYMSKNYNKVTNFSGTKKGDFFYIVENGKPQKIRCINVDRDPTAPDIQYSFVRVDNNNNIIGKNEENIGKFDLKGNVQINDISSCESNALDSDKSETYSGASILIMPCNDGSNALHIDSTIFVNTDLNGTATKYEPSNINVFWKKRCAIKNSATSRGFDG